MNHLWRWNLGLFEWHYWDTKCAVLWIMNYEFSFCVQSYTTNSAKVVFLNQRPQTKHFRGSGNTCTTCHRSLQQPYHYCSLFCKVFIFPPQPTQFIFSNFSPFSQSNLNFTLFSQMAHWIYDFFFVLFHRCIISSKQWVLSPVTFSSATTCRCRILVSTTV